MGIPCKYSYNGPQNSILIIKAPYYTSLIIDTLKRSPLKELLIPILKAPIVGLSGLGSSMKKTYLDGTASFVSLRVHVPKKGSFKGSFKGTRV